jgi:hypothetical protein
MNRQQELLAGNSAVNYEKFETWARAGPKDTPAEQGTGAGKNGDLMGFVWILYIYNYIWIYMDLYGSEVIQTLFSRKGQCEQCEEVTVFSCLFSTSRPSVCGS